ncbi:MAG: adenylate/guanylate cyclase domain-containing protein [Gammaproteobacteria bacterium]|nr:adenylate/guanylate cyclase domain-containing protein [Gammaproteobacteria bacterium]
MRRTFQALLIGLLIGFCGIGVYALPFGFAWEEDLGLGMLFKLRGERQAPDGVAIVSINDRTGPRLRVSNEITDWPRSLLARLIDNLSAAGAAVIVLDIHFKKPQAAEQDARLAKAFRNAGNVILFGYLDQEMVRLDDDQASVTSRQGLQIERLRRPIEPLAGAAAAVAPFVLPKVPAKVSRFWTFHGANELATLPVVALELSARRAIPDLLRLIDTARPGWGESLILDDEYALLEMLRNRLRDDRGLTRKLLEYLKTRQAAITTATRSQLEALLTMYLLPNHPYLNFIGPPRSIKTIPFEAVFSGDPQLLATLKHRVVFVGYAEDFQPKQKDGFYTVFSQTNGLDISGVEIAATAYANLSSRQAIMPLGPVGAVGLMLGFGLVVTLIFRLIPVYWNLLAGFGFCVLYLSAVYQLFVSQAVWLPWVIPMWLMAPGALLISLALNYREARHERQRLHKIFRYYLPERIIDRLTDDTSKALQQGESAFGVCLATDAEQYTKLAERMSPAALQILLNRYYETLFTPVRARDGMISDIVGDAMLAIWSASQVDRELRSKACEAALEIQQALRDMGQASNLPTRIGLHAGQFVLSHIGAIDHYEFRAVGDIVNTASRIENLNKPLGTSILASAETVAGLDEFAVRDLGVFQLKGKHHPVRLYELVCANADLTEGLERLHHQFAEAIGAHQREAWQEAAFRFEQLVAEYPEDGPSRFYFDLYRERRLGEQITLKVPPQEEF